MSVAKRILEETMRRDELMSIAEDTYPEASAEELDAIVDAEVKVEEADKTLVVAKMIRRKVASDLIDNSKNNEEVKEGSIFFDTEKWKSRVLKHMLIAGNVLCTMPNYKVGNSTTDAIGTLLLEEVAVVLSQAETKSMISDLSVEFGIKLPLNRK
jgi:hypothetical protein